MLEDGLISLIIPIYRTAADDLERCLRSCAAQEDAECEILLLVNGMTKAEAAYIEEIAGRIAPDRTEVCFCAEKGVSNARNEGIERAKGAWCAFVDSDDTLAPDFCRKLREPAEKTGSDITLCSVEKQLANSREMLNITEADREIDCESLLAGILNVQCGMGFAHSKLWRTEFLRKNRLRFDPALSMAEDAEFCIRALQCRPRVQLCREALYRYNCVSSSAVRSFRKSYAAEYAKSMKAIRETLSRSVIPFSETDYQNFVVYHVLLICVNYCYTPENQLSGREQHALLREVLKEPCFAEAVGRSDYRHLSFTRKVTLFLLKHRCYFAVKAISAVRHRQKQA